MHEEYDYITHEESCSNDLTLQLLFDFNITLAKGKWFHFSLSCRRCSLRAKIVAHMILLYIILVQQSQRKQKLPLVMRANIFRIVDKIIYVYISRCIATYIMIQVL